MALRIKPETREAWKTHLDELDRRGIQWRPVPRAEPAPEDGWMPCELVRQEHHVGPITENSYRHFPAPEKPKSLSRFDIYHEAWVD